MKDKILSLLSNKNHSFGYRFGCLSCLGFSSDKNLNEFYENNFR